MKLQNLSSIELTEINGGTEKEYNIGHSIGTHIRNGIKTAGEVISWVFDLLPG